MKKWMLFIALATPWAKKLWLILKAACMNPAMLADPVAGIKILVAEIICLGVIVLAIIAAIHQAEEEKELVEARREIRRLRTKK